MTFFAVVLFSPSISPKGLNHVISISRRQYFQKQTGADFFKIIIIYKKKKWHFRVFQRGGGGGGVDKSFELVVVARFL